MDATNFQRTKLQHSSAEEISAKPKEDTLATMKPAVNLTEVRFFNAKFIADNDNKHEVQLSSTTIGGAVVVPLVLDTTAVVLEVHVRQLVATTGATEVQARAALKLHDGDAAKAEAWLSENRMGEPVESLVILAPATILGGAGKLVAGIPTGNNAAAMPDGGMLSKLGAQSRNWEHNIRDAKLDLQKKLMKEYLEAEGDEQLQLTEATRLTAEQDLALWGGTLDVLAYRSGRYAELKQTLMMMMRDISLADLRKTDRNTCLNKVKKRLISSSRFDLVPGVSDVARVTSMPDNRSSSLAEESIRNRGVIGEDFKDERVRLLSSLNQGTVFWAIYNSLPQCICAVVYVLLVAKLWAWFMNADICVSYVCVVCFADRQGELRKR